MISKGLSRKETQNVRRVGASFGEEAKRFVTGEVLRIYVICV